MSDRGTLTDFDVESLLEPNELEIINDIEIFQHFSLVIIQNFVRLFSSHNFLGYFILCTNSKKLGLKIFIFKYNTLNLKQQYLILNVFKVYRHLEMFILRKLF